MDFVDQIQHPLFVLIVMVLAVVRDKKLFKFTKRDLVRRGVKQEVNILHEYFQFYS